MAPPTMERRTRRVPHSLPPAARRAVGLGLIAGAADDDPSAIGTYASAGAMFGPAILWLAPALLPIICAVMYITSKLGQVTGQGLVAVIKAHYPRWALWVLAAALIVGNVTEAGADLGGLAAAWQLILPAPYLVWVLAMAVLIFCVQFFGSYTWIRSIFRWLALVLLAYVGAALLSHPDWGGTLAATFVPHLHFTRQFFAIVVAIIGTAASPYMYVWQAGQQVEEDISMGRRRLSDRLGTSAAVLRATAWDVVTGMIFSVVVMYFILLATATTLYPNFPQGLGSAADSARALQPLAGHAAAALFAAGIIAVGVLAVPVMSVGAAYVVCDAAGWKSGLTAKPRDAKAFYAVISVVLLAAVGFNLLGFNPIHALVAAGVVQGFLAPVLLVILLRITSNPKIMGPWTNTRRLNLLGWSSATVLALAAFALILL